MIKYDSGATSIRQYEEAIKTHPTIIICPSWTHAKPDRIKKYLRDFTMSYTIVSSHEIEDKITLNIGENNLTSSKEKIDLKEIYTDMALFCYIITSTRKVDKSLTQIKIWSSQNESLPNMLVYFTSEKNSYGVTQRIWNDGKVNNVDISGGNLMIIGLMVEKHINLRCSDQSFYECVGSRISKSDLNNCSIVCMPITFPNPTYPVCPNYEKWYKIDNCTECECNLEAINNIIDSIKANEECPRSCSTIQYPLSDVADYTLNDKEKRNALVQYTFKEPLEVQVYEEYVIFDTVGLIGSVGGTLGLFIGFSFSNVVTCLVKYIQWVFAKKYSVNVNAVHDKSDETQDTNAKFNNKFAILEIQMQQEKDKMIKVEKELAQVVMQLAEFKNNQWPKFERRSRKNFL